MSCRITPIPALSDNYIWLLAQQGEAVCIDPGDAAPVLAHLSAHGLTLAHIWITHPHRDHIGGIAALKQAFPECRVWGGRDIDEADCTVGEGSRIVWQNLFAEVWHSPGHTINHLIYIIEANNRRHAFTGDTLFSAGCGRVFDSTPEALYHSLQRLNRLPEDTLLYPAHEYTAANLRFAAHIEPHNADIQAAAAAAVLTPTLPVTLAHERHINPFLRVSQPAVQARAQELSAQNLTDGTAVFTALRTLKNRF